MERQQNHIVEQFKSNENCRQDNDAHSYRAAVPVGSLPPQPTGGLTAFPANASKILPLQQSLVTFAFNVTKLQPRNPWVWRRLRRIFAMLSKERKEAKEVLWEFLGFDDDAGDKVGTCAEVLMLPKWFEKWILCFDAKSPPHDISTAWMFATILRLRRAPNDCLRVAG
jgi:hypothetical protein